MSWRLGALNLWLRTVEKPYLARETRIAKARVRLERYAALAAMPAEAVFSEAALQNDSRSVPALRLSAEAPAGVLLWLHGGAYCLGSPRTHAAMVAALARRAGLAAVLPDYRLAPEHPFPAACEDALTAWHGLLAEGWAPSRVVLGGDSAGGGLALALVHMLLEAELAPPRCLLAFCPWADLTLSGESLAQLAEVDVLVPAARLAEVRDLYLAGADPADPRASPCRGCFTGGPPTLLQASRAEMLADDARGMAERLRRDGVAVTLDLWDDTPHVWQMFQGFLSEADAALDVAAGFVRRQSPPECPAISQR